MLHWLLIAVILAAGYLLSLRRHPKRACRRCGGSKRHFDPVFRGARGLCAGCGGTGEKPRLGVRLLMPGMYRAIRDGQHGRYY